jgi:hypothetical protein
MLSNVNLIVNLVPCDMKQHIVDGVIPDNL